MAVALIIIVLIFIICHAFKFVINLVEFLDMYLSMFVHRFMNILWHFSFIDPRETYWGSFMDISVSISHLLVVLNCSVNFIIYCFKDYKFRTIFKNLLPSSFKASSIRMETVVEHEEWELDDIMLWFGFVIIYFKVVFVKCLIDSYKSKYLSTSLEGPSAFFPW